MKYLLIIIIFILTSSNFNENDRFKISNNNNSFKLISPSGDPFFSLGVTHTQALSYPDPMDIFIHKYENDWSKASKDVYRNLNSWEFNTAGYGAPKELRKLVDNGKKELKEGIIIVFASKDEKVGLAVGITEKLTESFDAVKFAKVGSEILGGKGGGGRKDFAQAGGQYIDKIEYAIESLKKLI